MRKLYLITCILLICSLQQSLQAQCTDIYIELTSQEDVDNFVTNYGCTVLEGDLFIDGTDIVNLNGLSSITSIGDDLLITDNVALGNIDGLNNLTFVGGNLSISSNGNLPNTNGLSNLQTIGGNLVLDESPTDYVFAGLETIEGSFNNLEGLASNTDALPSLTHIGGDLHFAWIGAGNVMVLSSLESIGGSLTISEGFELYSLDGLENLHTIGGNLTFDIPIDLQNVNGLSGLTSIGGDFAIYSFGYNTDFSGLDNVEGVGGNVFINSDNDFNSLNGLMTIGGNLKFFNNYDIESIMGFNSLTELQGDLEITNNMNLENIESLSSLSSIGGGISITQNQKLSNCCSALDWETLTTGNVTIENNNAGCSDYSDVVDYCNGAINYSCEGNVVLNSQEDIDNFAINYDCTVIQGSLLINSTNATNLDGLSALTSIEGSLGLNNNNSLNNIDGLSNLTSIGGALEIENCPSLYYTTGLSNLQSIGGDLLVHEKTYTFPNVTSIGGNLVDASFLIDNTDALQSLTTLGGDLFIYGYDIFPDLNSFSNLETIGGDLYLEELIGLENLEGFNNLESIGGNLGMWVVQPNNWSGFNNLTTIGGSLQIYDCTIPSFNVFSNVTTVGGLSFEGLFQLTSTEGFDNLSSITNNLSFYNTYNLTTLSGFNALTDIGGSMTIDTNQDILTISGFENLSTINNSLNITNNIKLTECCILLDWVEIVYGTVNIADNNEDCSTLAQITNLCSGTGNTCDGTIVLTSQEEVDNFATEFGCTNIGGNVFIQGENIINLDGLNTIESIEGDLRIEACYNLTNLDGLSNLSTVGGHFYLDNNSSIVSTNGFSNIETIGGDFTIYDYSVYNFPNLTSIGGSIPSIEFLGSNEEALTNLTYIGGDVYGYFLELNNLSCFSNLQTIGGTLSLDDFWGLTNLDGLENLTTLGSLSLWWMFSLENIDALSGLISINDIFIDGVGLTNLNGLSNITEVVGDVYINDAESLINIEGLHNITTIGGNLNMSFTNVEVIYGFDNLVSIGDELSIQDNNILEDIYGFNNLTSIGSHLYLSYNEDLIGLGGFNNLETIDGNIYVYNNPKLSNCCILKCLDGIGGNITLNDNNEGCNTFQEVIDNCADEYNDCDIDNIATISAFAFYDLNTNGIYDADDYGLFNQEFSLQPDELVSYTDDDGLVNFIVGDEDYTLVWENNPLWTLTTDNGAINVSNADNGAQFNFGLTPVTDFVQVFGDYVSAPTRCGFEVTSWLSYENIGTETTQGVIEYKMNDLVSFVEADPTPDFIDATTGILKWNYNELFPTYTEKIKLRLQMPGVDFIGSMINSEGFVYSLDEAGDTLSQSKFVHNSELTCAYDPNDKLVTPEGISEDNYTLFEDSLFNYTVRFQNTGNDTAFNIIILDTLSTDLDWETFHVTSSSHELKTVFNELTGIIEFQFKDIYLPDSNINEPNSHGFVKYDIEIKNGLEENTNIENTASIYFDFNPPIVTNTTENQMVTEIPLSLTSIIEKDGLHIYPNPTQDFLYINIENDRNEARQLKIFDVVGNELLSQPYNQNQSQIDVSHLPNGMYLLQIDFNNQLLNEKLIIQR